MGKNDAVHEIRGIGPRSDYFGEGLPWYRTELKSGSAGREMSFARVFSGDGLAAWRDSPVCNLF
jgi:hypothetical protein